MFFGYENRPAFTLEVDEKLVKRKKVNVCSRDKGRCYGSHVVTLDNGERGFKYAYRKPGTMDEYIYDDGVDYYSCELKIGEHTYAWYEPVEN